MNNPNKIQFIICANERRELEECRFYIGRLHIPEGMQVDITVVEHAASMAAGYNCGMQRSDAKYRIYLHQDTFLIYQDILEKLIYIFKSNTSVGLLGVIGAKQIPEDAVVHGAWDTGRVDTNSKPLELNYQSGEPESDIIFVEAVDGLFMATQYDLPWREDLFTKWDFYDISQSLEMKRRGYCVAVPYQAQAWCWHDNETSKLSNYEGERRIFCKEYGDIKLFEQKQKGRFNNNQNLLLEEFQKEIICMVDCGHIEKAEQLLGQYHALLGSKEQLICLENICYIRQIEKHMGSKQHFYGDGMKAWELLQNFREDKFLVKRIEYGDSDAAGQLLQKYQRGLISHAAVFGIAVCYAKNREKVIAQWNRVKSGSMEIQE